MVFRNFISYLFSSSLRRCLRCRILRNFQSLLNSGNCDVLNINTEVCVSFSINHLSILFCGCSNRSFEAQSFIPSNPIHCRTHMLMPGDTAHNAIVSSTCSVEEGDYRRIWSTLDCSNPSLDYLLPRGQSSTKLISHLAFCFLHPVLYACSSLACSRCC